MKQTRFPRLFTWMFLGLVACTPKKYYIHSFSASHYEISDTLPKSEPIVQMLHRYKQGVDTQMNVVIGETDIPLTKAQPECLLGNFMADAQLSAAQQIDPKSSVSILNYGGIRLPYLPPGKITKGQMFQLMPFDNMVAIVEMSGATLRNLCHHIAASKGWPVSGIRFKIKDKKAVDIQVGDQPLNDNIYYKVTMSDYLARGGDNLDFISPLRKRVTSIFLRDAMTEYVANLARQGKNLHPNIEHRISYDE